MDELIFLSRRLGCCWPSRYSIAKKHGMGRWTISRHIPKRCRLGFLHVQHCSRPRKAGTWETRTHRYRGLGWERKQVSKIVSLLAYISVSQRTRKPVEDEQLDGSFVNNETLRRKLEQCGHRK